jgi:CHAD domain-containing protein
MTEEALLDAEPTVAPVDSKWIAGIAPQQPVCEVAGRVLNARLKAVFRALPLAAEKYDEDVEHVHQLRISVRRAAETVKMFSGLLEEAEVDALQDRLRRIRLAADEARDWDVMAERFSHGGDIPTRILEQIQFRRREVQRPIVVIHEEITAAACEARIETLIEEVESCRHDEGRRRFGRQAPRYLAPVVKKFFKAAKQDLATDESLHGLRIRTKKLRYTMEIVAMAFDAAFRKTLYPRVTLFQDLLGTAHDHAKAKILFGDWLSNSADAEQKAFLEGLVLAEAHATEDLRAAFLATWTPRVVSDLKRQFRAYCG